MHTLLQVVSMQTRVPNLQELHLCNNNIAALSHTDPCGSIFPQLQVRRAAPDKCSCLVIVLVSDAQSTSALPALQLLDLEDNCLSDWAEVMHVSQLPCLRHLWLGNNQLQHIQLPPGMSS